MIKAELMMTLTFFDLLFDGNGTRDESLELASETGVLRRSTLSIDNIGVVVSEVESELSEETRSIWTDVDGT